jgi:protein O-mannosyl-transferase
VAAIGADPGEGWGVSPTVIAAARYSGECRAGNLERRDSAAEFNLENFRLSAKRKQRTARPVSADAPRRRPWLAVVVIVIGGIAAWSNSFDGAFVFDDHTSIAENPTIHRLWPLSTVLSPPRGGHTVEGRPLLNLSLAINYALGGLNVWGYHAVNLGIHLLAGLTLFCIVRRTLLLESLRDRFEKASTGLALAVALIWTLHPLQTESVTYIVQRAESLAGLLYLLALYCFLRSVDSPRSAAWRAASVAACLLGMGAKEVVVSAPLIVLLYDRTFVAGSFAAALRRGWPVYVGLASTWGLLAWQVVAAGGRSGTAGFNAGVGVWDYALTQCEAISWYLRLCIWPRPLVLDYGRYLTPHTWAAAPYVLFVALLVVGTIVALSRWPGIGFLGVWFFATLAPTSSIVPVATQTIAEHRMYLPLAAVVALAVFGFHFLWQAALAQRGATQRDRGWLRAAPAIILVAASVTLALQTRLRNFDYHSELAIYQDCTAKWPQNPRAHASLGQVYLESGDPERAIAAFDRAIAIEPQAAVLVERSIAHQQRNDLDRALADINSALALAPNHPDAWYNRGVVHASRGDAAAALADYTRAIELRPTRPEAFVNRAAILGQLGRVEDALADYARAIELDPVRAETWYSRGTLLGKNGRDAESIADLTSCGRTMPPPGPTGPPRAISSTITPPPGATCNKRCDWAVSQIPSLSID